VRRVGGAAESTTTDVRAPPTAVRLPVMSDHSLRPLSEGLDKVVRSLRGAGAQATYTLFGRWQAVVGEAIAAHAKPVKIEHGRLLVHVDEPGWATQLRYLESDLVERLTAAGVDVTAIDLRVRH
jgi:predicted nucleic acid-binding Zn ribbon protein